MNEAIKNAERELRDSIVAGVVALDEEIGMDGCAEFRLSGGIGAPEWHEIGREDHDNPSHDYIFASIDPYDDVHLILTLYFPNE